MTGKRSVEAKRRIREPSPSAMPEHPLISYANAPAQTKAAPPLANSGQQTLSVLTKNESQRLVDPESHPSLDPPQRQHCTPKAPSALRFGGYRNRIGCTPDWKHQSSPPTWSPDHHQPTNDGWKSVGRAAFFLPLSRS